MILDRESLMTKLEDFERTASDPNRFFVRGKRPCFFSRVLIGPIFLDDSKKLQSETNNENFNTRRIKVTKTLMKVG